MLMMMNQSSHGGVVVEGSREELLVFQTRMAHAVGGGCGGCDAVVGKCASFLLPNGGWRVIKKGKNCCWKSKKKGCASVALAMHHRPCSNPCSYEKCHSIQGVADVGPWRGDAHPKKEAIVYVISSYHFRCYYCSWIQKLDAPVSYVGSMLFYVQSLCCNFRLDIYMASCQCGYVYKTMLINSLLLLQ